MSQIPIERLRDYLAQLPPQAQALLMREFERAVEGGPDAAVASLVLEQLRWIVRRAAAADRPDATAPGEDPAHQLFRPLEPFLIDGKLAVRPGQIRRSSLLPVWQWLARDGVPDQLREFQEALQRIDETETTSGPDKAVRKLQMAAADAIIAIAAAGSDRDMQRELARVGSPEVIEDLIPIASVLQAREALDTLNARLPSYLRTFADSQINSATSALASPMLQSPQVLPFALSLIMQRLGAPWQIIRLAVKMAGSDDEIRVAATSSGIAISMVLHDLSNLAASLRLDIKRCQFTNVADHLKLLHEAVRGLRSELDLRHDSVWGKQLAAIRADVSTTLQSEIESVPGRVRRLLRQRPDKDLPAGAGIAEYEVDETAALIDFVAVCRNYAGELAINEVTSRTYLDLQHYVEQSTEQLVEALRNAEPRTRNYRHAQVTAAIRFCEVLFGHDYASLMSRAVDNAFIDERKTSRAG